MYYSANGKLTTVGRHIGIHHRYQSEVVQFYVLEVVLEDPCGGGWDREILRRESLWIEQLSNLIPTGLNEAQSYNNFL